MRENFQYVKEIYGSNDATRESFKLNIIKNGEICMSMVKDRNLSSHTYNEDIAEDLINEILNDYFEEFLLIRRKIK